MKTNRCPHCHQELLLRHGAYCVGCGGKPGNALPSTPFTLEPFEISLDDLIAPEDPAANSTEAGRRQLIAIMIALLTVNLPFSVASLLWSRGGTLWPILGFRVLDFFCLKGLFAGNRFWIIISGIYFSGIGSLIILHRVADFGGKDLWVNIAALLMATVYLTCCGVMLGSRSILTYWKHRRNLRQSGRQLSD